MPPYFKSVSHPLYKLNNRCFCSLLLSVYKRPWSDWWSDVEISCNQGTSKWVAKVHKDLDKPTEKRRKQRNNGWMARMIEIWEGFWTIAGTCIIIWPHQQNIKGHKKNHLSIVLFLNVFLQENCTDHNLISQQPELLNPFAHHAPGWCATYSFELFPVY